MIRRVGLISLVAAVTGLGVVASAQAATVIGQTGPPDTCSGSNFGGQVQLSATGVSYTVPFEGTITSWSAASDEPGAQTKLLILQPVSGTTFNVVAKSDFGTFTSTGVQTFPAQIPVHAGQVIGDFGQLCGIDDAGPPGDQFGIFEGFEPAAGTNQDFPDSSSLGSRTDLSATVEQTAAPSPSPSPSQPVANKKKCKKKKHKRSAESAKKKKCKKKKGE
jgi:hypothetical protein